jgi:hypothetical protein
MLLTDTKVDGLRAKDKPYTLSDKNPSLKPGALAIKVSPLQGGKANKGSKAWVYTYKLLDPIAGNPKKKRIGLGAYPAVSLAAARAKAMEKAALVGAGKDPQEARQEAINEARALAKRASLKDVVETYVAGLEADALKNERGGVSAASVRSMVKRYVYSHKSLPDTIAADITPADISTLLARAVEMRKQVKEKDENGKALIVDGKPVMVDRGKGNKTTQARLRQALHAPMKT